MKHIKLFEEFTYIENKPSYIYNVFYINRDDGATMPLSWLNKAMDEVGVNSPEEYHSMIDELQNMGVKIEKDTDDNFIDRFYKMERKTHLS